MYILLCLKFKCPFTTCPGLCLSCPNFFEAVWQKGLFGQGVDLLNVTEPFTFMSTFFHSDSYIPHLDLYRPFLLFHTIFDLYKMLVLTHVYVTKYIHYPQPILYTYIFNIAVVLSWLYFAFYSLSDNSPRRSCYLLIVTDVEYNLSHLFFC